MKKYKLKKWYPSLPKEMKVCDEVLFDGKFYTMRVGNSNITIGIPRGEIENNPEFWKEVKVKDYEILSFENICLSDSYRSLVENKRAIINLGDIGNSESEDFIICKERFEAGTSDTIIYSVQRLSDNEIFTVGDKIIGATYNDPREILAIVIRAKIIEFKQSEGYTELPWATKVKEPEKLSVPIGTKFKSCNDTILIIYKVEGNIVWVNWEGDKKGNSYDIKRVNELIKGGHWTEVKHLLITEDGKELFEGNSYTTVNSNFSIFSGYTVPKDFKPKKDIKYFSSWGLASNYVEENKPRFSKKQLREEFNEYSDYCFPINNLKEKFELL